MHGGGSGAGRPGGFKTGHSFLLAFASFLGDPAVLASFAAGPALALAVAGGAARAAAAPTLQSDRAVLRCDAAQTAVRIAAQARQRRQRAMRHAERAAQRTPQSAQRARAHPRETVRARTHTAGRG